MPFVSQCHLPASVASRHNESALAKEISIGELLVGDILVYVLTIDTSEHLER